MKRIVLFINDRDHEELDRIEVLDFYYSEDGVLYCNTGIDARQYDNVKEICLLEKTQYDEFYDVILDI